MTRLPFVVVVAVLVGCVPESAAPDAGVTEVDAGHTASAPVARLKAPTVEVNNRPFLLDGRDSTAGAGRAIARYFWTNVDAPGVATLPQGATLVTSAPTFSVEGSAIPVGTFRFELVVEDDASARSEVAAVSVVLLDALAAPSAVLDLPERAMVGSTLTLQGGRSSTGQGTLTHYRWTNVDYPGGADAGFAPGQTVATTTPSYAVPLVVGRTGTFRFELEVESSLGVRSDPSSSSVQVSSGDAPTAVLSITSPHPRGAPLSLTGRGFAAAGAEVVSYEFTNLSMENAADFPVSGTITQSGATLVVSPGAGGFTGDAGAFRLVVFDNRGNASAPDQMEVTLQ